MSVTTISPAKRVEGELRVPGDKSISHRALMVAAAGTGDCTIRGLGTARDVSSTLSVLRPLADVIGPDLPAVEVEGSASSGSSWEILVRGRTVGSWKNPGRTLDCGNSGTTIRTLLGLLAACDFQATLDGDESLRTRPMERIAEPLRRMGAAVSTTDAGTPPITIRGGQLQGVEHRLPVPSAQIKTALLFAGLHAEGETVVAGGGASRDHTERLLRYLGCSVDGSVDRLIVKSTHIQNVEVLDIPGDLSSAAFLLVAAALLPGSDLRVTGVGVNPTRAGILDVLRRFGARVDLEDGSEACGEPRATVRVRAGDRRALHIGAAGVPAMIDELPLVAILGAFADGETVIEGAAELRVKESDRIATTAAGLAALGVPVRTSPDGMVVTGNGRTGGGVVDSGGDHRIAMGFAVAGLAADAEVTIRGWDAVGVSYPSFASNLASILVPNG
ncbi:MAG TPA: 3-phosphoshikimate 1-carboxyvinyltransferase [Actinomycetota bacterium]